MKPLAEARPGDESADAGITDRLTAWPAQLALLFTKGSRRVVLEMENHEHFKQERDVS
jgi:hypothetical protein